MDFPAPGALARFGALGVWFTLHAQGPSSADSLRSLVITVITDDRAPVPVRNHCHRLMLAIEKNNQTLVDESLASLERVAESTGYRLPPSNPVSSPTLDLIALSGASEPRQLRPSKSLDTRRSYVPTLVPAFQADLGRSG